MMVISVAAKKYRIDAVVGESLPGADRLEVIDSPLISSLLRPTWKLRGVTGNVCYSNRGRS